MIYGEQTLQKAIRTAGFEDAQGDFHQERTEWGDFIPCDIKPLGKASSTEYGNGKVIAYSYEIMLDCDCGNFLEGDLVCLHFQDRKEVLSIIGVARRKTYVKLWV